MGSRILSIALVGLLVVGFSAVHPWAATSPVPDPFGSVCTLRYRQSSGVWTNVTSVNRSKDPAVYYDYYSASAHTEFVEAYVSKAYFYRDTTAGKLYFFFHHNIDEVGSSDAAVDFDFSALPSGVQVVVSDDPGEFQLGRSPEAQDQFWYNTDGGVLGPFPATDWSFTLVPVWGGLDPMTAWRFVDGNGVHRRLDMSKPLEVASVCNQPPNAVAGGPYSGTEGAPITFNASKSSDPDGDPLAYRWDFQSDGTWDTNWSTSPTAAWTWGDDWSGSATLEVGDGKATDTETASVVVGNVAPSIDLAAMPSGNESDALTFQAWATDPGSDDLTFWWWGDCEGWATHVYPNDPAAFPDPYPSPDVHPRNVTDTQAIVCGDDGSFAWKLKVTDDDGGSTSLNGSFSVANLPPSLTAPPPEQLAVDEGTQVSLAATAQDPGSDDLVFSWAWQYGPTDVHTYYNDGVGPDPPSSPWGTFPFTATDGSSCTYGDDGTYLITLTVSDDDGGSLAHTTTITVGNVPPAVDAGPDKAADEGSAISFVFMFSDPGFDQPAAGTYENFTATVDWGDGTSGSPAVTKTTGHAGVPTTGTITASHTYADNGNYTATVTVCDDDGGCGYDALLVMIGNVAPSVDPVSNQTVDEGSLLSLTFTFSDPGFDFPPAGTVEDFDATVTWGDTTSDSPQVNETPGSPGVPTTGTVDASHVFADDGDYLTAAVICDDDGGCGSTSLVVTVTNVPPTIEAGADRSTDEGSLLPFTFAFSDPGFDFPPAGTFEDFTAKVAWGDGTMETLSVDEVPGGPGVPTTGTMAADHVYADNGLYVVFVTVCDDDGGCGNDTLSVTVNNVPPSVAAGPDGHVDEGSVINFTFAFSDPGFDFPPAGTVEDFNATVDWGDGTGGPLAVFEVPGHPGDPTTGTVPAAHIYADNGTYVVTVVVCDDDGGCGNDSLLVTVENVPPAVEAGPDRVVDEADPLAVEFSFTDPGFDFPPAGTVEDFTATVDWGYGPAQDATVNETPGSPGVPTSGTISLVHVYGDNGVFLVTVTVCDDDGGCGADSMTVTVGNVPPSIVDLEAYVVANLTLRVAGEKWHDVRMDLVWDGNVTGSVSVVRQPGSPDDQTATIHGGRIQLLGSLDVVLYYTPDDDPINGQPNGANPAWVFLMLPDGSDVEFHHTFNVLHPDTWTWHLSDLRPFFVRQPITFDGTASDVGSDDLTFIWSFGDGTADVTTTYYNDGSGPDPYPSPEVNPLTARDIVTHAFGAAGAYAVTLTVEDDDGGVSSVSVTIGFP